MTDLEKAQQELESYRLLWRENEDRLDHLELLRRLMTEDVPDPRFWLDAMEGEAPVFEGSQSPERGCHGVSSAAAVLHVAGKGSGLPDPETAYTAPRRKQRAAEEYKAYQNRIAPQLAENRRRMTELENTVDRLPDPLVREVLRLRYFDGGFVRLTPWRLVAMRLYGDDDPAALQYIRRLHTQALRCYQQQKDADAAQSSTPA